MAASLCATPIKGRVMRIVQLNECGVPVTGASGMVGVSGGFVQIQSEPQYEDGEEFFERTADGLACVNQKDDPTLKRFQLTIDFCEIDPTVASFIMSARAITTGAGPTGIGFAVSEGTPSNRFSLEVWQRVAGSGACDASGLQRYVYNAWPNLGATQIGQYTIENGRSTLQIQAESRGGSTSWGAGPGTGTEWIPVGQGVVTGLEHWFWDIVTTAPPTAACGTSLLT